MGHTFISIPLSLSLSFHPRACSLWGYINWSGEERHKIGHPANKNNRYLTYIFPDCLITIDLIPNIATALHPLL